MKRKAIVFDEYDIETRSMNPYTPSTEEGIDLAKLVKSQKYPFNESLCPYIIKRLSRLSLPTFLILNYSSRQNFGKEQF